MIPIRDLMEFFIIAAVAVLSLTLLSLLRLPELPPPGRLILGAGIGAALFFLLGIIVDVFPRKR